MYNTGPTVIHIGHPDVATKIKQPSAKNNTSLRPKVRKLSVFLNFNKIREFLKNKDFFGLIPLGGLFSISLGSF